MLHTKKCLYSIFISEFHIFLIINVTNLLASFKKCRIVSDSVDCGRFGLYRESLGQEEKKKEKNQQQKNYLSCLELSHKGLFRRRLDDQLSKERKYLDQ